jgi:hypothetical protein
LSRPWAHDAFIKRVLDENVHGKHSICQKLEHSTLMQAWFRDFQDMLSTGPKCSNLRAAKHRFETFSKPLGRMVLHLKAIFATAQKVVSVRRDETALQGWLDTVSGEDLLQLAMCADASDEAMLLVRAFDSESMDIAETLGRTRDFLQRVEALFGAGRCLTTMGYTQHCKELLDSGELLAYTSRGPRNLGFRLTAQAVKRCLGRMACWVALARDVINSEFPSCDVLTAFSVFDLGEPRNPAQPLGTVDSAAVGRLAMALNVDVGGLTAQLERLKPVARNLKADRQCDNKEAWVAAWRRTQGHAQTRPSYPSEHLWPVLLRCSPLHQNLMKCVVPSCSGHVHVRRGFGRCAFPARETISRAGKGRIGHLHDARLL